MMIFNLHVRLAPSRIIEPVISVFFFSFTFLTVCENRPSCSGGITYSPTCAGFWLPPVSSRTLASTRDIPAVDTAVTPDSDDIFRYPERTIYAGGRVNKQG